MCDELGNDDRMQAYVEDAGSTSLCSVATGAGCSDKEASFIGKWKAKSTEDATKDLARLQGMTGGTMKPELKKWLKQRIGILKQLSGGKDEL